jgi:hypothetical protein
MLPRLNASILNCLPWLIVHSLISGTSHVLMPPHSLDVSGPFVILLNTEQSVVIPYNSQSGLRFLRCIINTIHTFPYVLYHRCVDELVMCFHLLVLRY